MKHIFTKYWWKHWLSVPFIWFMLIPAVILHAFLEVYHQVSFRLYGIDRVKLSTYIAFDRQKLGYLSTIDKLNCAYCSYVNGIFAYASEIGHRTEYYWCAIKHANQPDNPAFTYQDKFAAYGDSEAFESIRASR